MSLFNFNNNKKKIQVIKKKRITNCRVKNPEIKKLETEIKNHEEYLKKLVDKFYNNPGNDWKQRKNNPFIYMS